MESFVDSFEGAGVVCWVWMGWSSCWLQRRQGAESIARTVGNRGREKRVMNKINVNGGIVIAARSTIKDRGASREG